MLLAATAPEGGLLPLLAQSLDEDWYSDVRHTACYVVQLILEQVWGPPIVFQLFEDWFFRLRCNLINGKVLASKAGLAHFIRIDIAYSRQVKSMGCVHYGFVQGSDVDD